MDPIAPGPGTIRTAVNPGNPKGRRAVRWLVIGVLFLIVLMLALVGLGLGSGLLAPYIYTSF